LEKVDPGPSGYRSSVNLVEGFPDEGSSAYGAYIPDSQGEERRSCPPVRCPALGCGPRSTPRSAGPGCQKSTSGDYLAMDDREFRRLLDYLELSWPGYRRVRKGVKKRIRRHMQAQGCRSMQEYLERLRGSAEVRGQSERLLSVSISRFFRDRALWEVLRGRILPELIQACGDRIRVWSAGCARGEEAYSLRILWESLNRPAGGLPVLEITATDLNPHFLLKAKEALYPASSLRELPEDLKAAWFQAAAGEKRFEVKPALKSNIVWMAHNFLSGPPGYGFHLILIRNSLLTYYPEKITGPVLGEILKALAEGGYVIVGSHETPPFQSSVLKPSPALSYAFSNR
jgi:chemotaxis methyl-accepting protein methylase